MKTKSKQLHEKYLKQLATEKKWVRFFQLLILVVLLSSWEVCSRMNWVNPLIFSSPSKVYFLFLEKIQDGSLIMHLGVTLSETILGFILGTILGTILAAILWSSNFLSRILDPYLVVLNSMPKVALGPILIVALGPGFVSIVAMGMLISIIITTINVYTSFKNTDPNYIKVLQTFGASKWQIFKEVVFPSSFAVIISTLKVNVGLSWVGVIVGEFLVSTKGLGYMIIYGFQVFNFSLVMLSLLVIAVCATLMYQLVDRLEKKWIKEGM